jgi:hypothetical protein
VVRFSYRAVCGLIYLADHFWAEIDGACARRGVDPLSLGFDRFLNLIYSWACERVQHDENGRAELDEALFGTEERDRRRGLRGDNVSQEVVDEEWALFNALSTMKTEVG